MPANRTQPRLDFGTAGNWNAIQARARDFVDRWKDADGYEKGEAQNFWSEFLAVFGVDYKRAVDRLYRPKPFEDDADRVALLLRRYQALVAS